MILIGNVFVLMIIIMFYYIRFILFALYFFVYNIMFCDGVCYSVVLLVGLDLYILFGFIEYYFLYYIIYIVLYDIEIYLY